MGEQDRELSKHWIVAAFDPFRKNRYVGVVNRRLSKSFGADEIGYWGVSYGG
jgi:hypothetical protein